MINISITIKFKDGTEKFKAIRCLLILAKVELAKYFNSVDIGNVAEVKVVIS